MKTLLLAAVTVGLSGCFWGSYADPYGGSTQAYPSGDPYTYEAKTYPGCSALEVASTGDVGKDVLGTWQDWNGGTRKLTTLTDDGTITIGSFPTGQYGEADETKPLTIEQTGKFTVAENKLTIKWEDGEAELNPVLVETMPGCTMLVLGTGEAPKTRIPNPSELERVSCTPPDAAANPGAVTSR